MDAKRREQFESQLSAYLDGEVTPDQRAEVEAFLAEDADARALLEELRTTIAAVQSLPRAQASDALMEGLRTRLERKALLGTDRPTELAPEVATPFAGRRIAAAAIIALTFGAGYLVWSLARQEPGGPIYTLRERPPSAETPAAGEGLGDEGGPEVAAGDEGTIHADGVVELADLTAEGEAPVHPPVVAKSDDGRAPRKLGKGGAEFGVPVESAEAPIGGTAGDDRPSGRQTIETAVAVAEPAPLDATAVQPAAPSDMVYDDANRHITRQAEPMAYWTSLGGDGDDLGGLAGKGWTVVQLTYADEASQLNAVETIRERYSFRGVGMAGARRARARPGGAPESRERLPGTSTMSMYAAWLYRDPDAGVVPVLTLDVPDQQTLTGILRSVRSDTDATDLRIVASPEPARAAGEMLEAQRVPAEEGSRAGSTRMRPAPKDGDARRFLHATRPAARASQPSAPAASRAVQTWDREGSARGWPNVVRLYVRVHPAATRPADEGRASLRPARSQPAGRPTDR